MDLFSVIVSLALYVLLGLGLYTIAQRRGIRYAWLAWVPVGFAWVLGSIADDYMLKTRGKQQKMRILLPALLAAVVVLCVVVLGMIYNTVIRPLEGVLDMEDLAKLYESAYQQDSVSHMFASEQELLMEELEAKLDAAMTDEMMENLLQAVLPMTGLAVMAAIASLAGTVLEWLCLYRLFASCDPSNKVLFFVISVLFGFQGVLVFLCRDKDLGMQEGPTALPPQRSNYWQQDNE